MNQRPTETGWLEEAIHAPVQQVETLTLAASDRTLTEDLALAMLRRRDLPAKVVETLGKNLAVVRLRTVRYALLTHHRTPRHISLPLLRHLYPFELMKLAVVPHLAADLKRAAEETLITKCVSLSGGERLTLAKQGSSLIAAEMLLDSEPRVTSATLDNPRLTAAGVIAAILSPKTPPHLASAVCHHPKWRLRTEIQVSALRCEFTPLARAIDFASRIPTVQLKDVLSKSKLGEPVKQYLIQVAEKNARK
jgi:hypothetical protein